MGPQRGYRKEAATGKKVWSLSLGPPEGGSCPIDPSPAVANGVVYISGGEDGAAAVNATTGKELWGGSPVNILVCSSPAVANGVVYTDSGPVVAALNASTGKLLWFFRNASGNPSPAVANGVLYLATGGGVVYALRASTGKELWHSHISSHVNQSSPVVANGRLYLGSGSKQVFAFAP